MTFSQFYLYISLITLTLAFIYDNKQFDLKWSNLGKFAGFMLFVTCVRLCTLDPSTINTYGISFSDFKLVFLEDVFFAMIPYYLCKLFKNKYLKFIIWSIFSIMFGLGHIYQGYLFAAITLFYPYYISRRYAMKTSFLTVMMCHLIYDCLTLLVQKMILILHVFRDYI